MDKLTRLLRFYWRWLWWSVWPAHLSARTVASLGYLVVIADLAKPTYEASLAGPYISRMPDLLHIAFFIFVSVFAARVLLWPYIEVQAAEGKKRAVNEGIIALKVEAAALIARCKSPAWVSEKNKLTSDMSAYVERVTAAGMAMGSYEAMRLSDVTDIDPAKLLAPPGVTGRVAEHYPRVVIASIRLQEFIFRG